MIEYFSNNLNMFVLPLVLMLIVAPIVALQGNRVAYNFTFGTMILISLLSLVGLINFVPSFYVFGNWHPKIGIAFKIDEISLAVQLVLCLVAVLCLLHVSKTFKHYIATTFQAKVLCIFLLLFASLIGMSLSYDLFNIYVFLEISSLSAYTLAATGKDPKGLVATFRYLIIGTMAALFYLLGVGILFALTGGLNIEDVAGRLTELIDINLQILPLLRFAFILIVVGLLVKIAVMPFSFWQVDVYTHASLFYNIAAAPILGKVMIIILIKLISSINIFKEMLMEYTIYFSALVIIHLMFCNLVAYFKNNLRSMIAWASLTSNGYFLLPLFNNFNSGSIKLSIKLMIIDVVTKLTLWFVISVLEVNNITKLRDVHGLFLNNRFLAINLIIAFATLIGIPITIGFLGKFMMIKYFFSNNIWFIIPIIVSSVFAILCGLKIVTNIFDTSIIHQKAIIVTSQQKISISVMLIIQMLMLTYFNQINDLIDMSVW
ncbi:proton-conducting transporter transmembrane domain-containing protein [Rickettsiales endosymbiont of Stachyamoeba lipophora]|uniref:proton-conducting transporter transmembrane domain-containing protein n=1 Tax=Rickettsiales endosymbiont of Stachyamoeba lipophora TaxID=2486578 RepID=UPI000F64818D|nr:proton-conducting transporter membrane subunit [Rickettsiales endosymbiont of Stachyamoeba lipophora]AZL15792.1 hypothetical protein EF513_04435 [Rickettsiales endosymbiont of Stachyamoeba lipophora]